MTFGTLCFCKTKTNSRNNISWYTCNNIGSFGSRN